MNIPSCDMISTSKETALSNIPSMLVTLLTSHPEISPLKDVLSNKDLMLVTLLTFHSEISPLKVEKQNMAPMLVTLLNIPIKFLKIFFVLLV
jgi:hypothetical protein